MTDQQIAFWPRVRAFFYWLGAPVRAIARGLMTLVSLTPRQIQSLCTVFLIGAIVVFSWQQWFYVVLARAMAREGVPNESKAWDVLTSSAGDLFWMIGICIVSVCMIAWGATWFSVKHREIELRAGKNPEDEPGEDI